MVSHSGLPTVMERAARTMALSGKVGTGFPSESARKAALRVGEE